MRGLAVLFVLIAAQVTPSHTFAANSTQQTVSREVIWGSPRVILRIDPTTTQRQVQLVGQGISGYPTVDITCDGTRWTLPLTRSEFAKNRTTATYAVPEDRAGRMLKAVECRLLIPGQDIAMARQQLRAWASPSQGEALQREARKQKPGLRADSSTTAPSQSVAQTVSQSEGVRPGVRPESASTCPAPQPVKGNFTTHSGERCIYHASDGQFYGRTKPERCYATEAEAQQDGCRRSGR